MSKKSKIKKQKRNWKPRCPNCQKTGFEFIGLALGSWGKREYKCTCCGHKFQYGYDGGPYQEWIDKNSIKSHTRQPE